MSRFKISLVALLVTVAGCGTGDQSEPAAEGRSKVLSVYAVNYPLAYFAERIGGELVEVHFPAPTGEDPAYWSPDAETIAQFQGADLILLNGAGYAKWVERATLPASKIVDSSASFADGYIPMASVVTHSHGPEGAHEHGGRAFTTWLDPTLAIEQARAIQEALAAARPDLASAFGQGFAGLVSDLSALDQRLSEAFGMVGDEPLLFSHPVYQYLIQRYSLNGRSVHWEPEQAPDLVELEHLLEEQAARWMVWEGEPPPETAAQLEEYGVSSVVYDPCGNVPAVGDFMTVMAANAAAIEPVAAD